MADCCEDKTCAVEALAARQRKTLHIVLAINLVMFIVELSSGLYAGSSSLLADSLDNLGDAATYALSLYALGYGMRTKARIALIKAALILGAGIFVLGQVCYRLMFPVIPVYETMGLISILALLANGVCFGLLWKHRREDVNMSSVWECSRNDIAANLSVFIAAGLVWATGSGWPDIMIGLGLAVLFLRSAVRVFKHAQKELRQPPVIQITRRKTPR